MGKIHKKRCVVCERVFDASKSNAKTCSGACRAKLFRQRRGNVVKAQAKVIKTQAKVISKIRKELTEYKYPSGEVVHLSDPGIEDVVKELSFEQIIIEVNRMVREAKEAAVKDGKFEEYWSSGYVKDSIRFRTLLRAMPFSEGYNDL